MSADVLGSALAAAFFMAADTNRVEIVKEEFGLPDVRRDLAVWSTASRAHRLGEPSLITSDQPLYVCTRLAEAAFALSLGISDRVEMMRWLFGRDQLAVFEEVLRGVLVDVMQACVTNGGGSSIEKVEILVDSVLFQEVMSDQGRWAALGFLKHTAAARGHACLVDALLAYGTEPRFQSFVGSNDVSATVGVLVAHGAPLLGAQLSMPLGTGSLVSDLLRHGADANAAVAEYGSALHYAASWCLVDASRSLVQQGFADVDARDRFARTPLMVVGQHVLRILLRGEQAQEHRALVQLLAESGALLKLWMTRAKAFCVA